VETAVVTLEPDGDGTAVGVGDARGRVLGDRAVSEFVYGAVHDRVLDHARDGGWLRLHLAVVEIAGRRVGIAGSTGAGKSTTVLALALRGATVHGDEVAFVKDGETIALPRPLHFKHGTMRLYPWLAERSIRLDYEPPVHVLDPATIDVGAARQTVARLDALVLLHGSVGADARREPASVADGLAVLLPDAAAFNPDHRGLARSLAGLLGVTRIVRVRPGTPDATAQLIESVASS
jgi:hypothetical protein